MGMEVLEYPKKSDVLELILFLKKKQNFLTTVAILLEAGAFVNLQQSNGETALMKVSCSAPQPGVYAGAWGKNEVGSARTGWAIGAALSTWCGCTVTGLAILRQALA